MATSPDVLNDRISTLFFEVRKSRSLSQQDMAKSLKISQPHLSKIENGQARPGVIEWLAFCEVYDVPTELALEAKEFATFISALKSAQSRKQGASPADRLQKAVS